MISLTQNQRMGYMKTNSVCVASQPVFTGALQFAFMSMVTLKGFFVGYNAFITAGINLML